MGLIKQREIDPAIEFPWASGVTVIATAAIAKLDLIEDDAHTEKILPRSSEDAIAALTALGYSDKDASDKVRRAREREPSADTETLVRFVLRG